MPAKELSQFFCYYQKSFSPVTPKAGRQDQYLISILRLLCSDQLHTGSGLLVSLGKEFVKYGLLTKVIIMQNVRTIMTNCCNYVVSFC